MTLDIKLGSYLTAFCNLVHLETDGLAGHCSREEPSLLQFVLCSVHLLECVDVTHMTVRDHKHRG